MKKLLTFIAFALVSFTANAQSYTYDVNNDGVMNITDVTCLVNKILGQTNPDEVTNVPPLQLSPRKLNLTKGTSDVVKIISGSGYFAVFSCKEAVATASLSGTSITVTATGEGNTYITVTDTESGQALTIKVTVTDGETPSLLSCPDDHHPHLIDLGLPSGTLWSCCNIGADQPMAHGGYYAWGETKEKVLYNDFTYLYSTGVDEDGDGWYDDYNASEGTNGQWQNIGEDIAGTQYDVAYVDWGDSWRMPNSEQIKELLNNCTSEWTTINGVNGRIFKGSNGKTIFLPAAGHRWGDSFAFPGDWGDYWSSSMKSSSTYIAHSLDFHKDVAAWNTSTRFNGLNVRPIYVGSTPNSFVLSMSSVETYVGESVTVRITLGSDSYTVSSSNLNVATASLSGNTITITGIDTGSAVVTVKDTTTGKSKTISITVSNRQSYLSCPDDNHPHLIDLGLPSGTKWACCNVDANTPVAYGGYYAWGETVEKSVYNDVTYQYGTGVDEDGDGLYDDYHENEDTYGLWQYLGDDIAGTKYDVARVKWGGSWRMPNLNELLELLDYCSSKWTTLNGVKGFRFTGSNNGTIFLPAAGFRDSKSMSVGSEGYYWTSSHQEPNLNTILLFNSHYPEPFTEMLRSNGYTVRPVSK